MENKVETLILFLSSLNFFLENHLFLTYSMDGMSVQAIHALGGNKRRQIWCGSQGP